MKPPNIKAGRFSFPIGRRTYIMGILNVTPDSFSDGGRYVNPDQALRHAEAMLRQGADIIDVGGESTRPGSLPVSQEDELRRVVPIVELISRELACPISVDTYKPAVAAEALAAGACLLNDINGLQQDSRMAEIAARNKAGVIIMHNARLYRHEQQQAPLSGDLMTDVVHFLEDSIRIGTKAGLGREQMIIDPGIGFGVSPEESIEMITRLNELGNLGLPILIGPSRKRFIGHILDRPASERLFGTCSSVAVAIAYGADFVRIHDVQEIADVVHVADAICRFTKQVKEG